MSLIKSNLILLVALIFLLGLAISHEGLPETGTLKLEIDGQTYTIKYEIVHEDENANKNYTLCDPNNRPEVCTLEYRGVCAFRENCEDGNCTVTAATGCSACSDPNVYAWMDGECEAIQTPCDPNTNWAAALCLADYSGVCGIKLDCDGDDCFGSNSNGCTACGAGFNYSLPTDCPPRPEQEDEDENKNYTLCDPDNRPEVCTLEYRGVSAFRENCEDGNCTVTAATGCSACSDTNVYAWMDGECEDIQTPCDPNINVAATSCLADYIGACGIKLDCDGDDCFGTNSNDCTACTAGFNYSLPTACPPRP
jgi:hypothetical protein